MSIHSDEKYPVLQYLDGCIDCEPIKDCYTVKRVRQTIRRICKQALMPNFGEQILHAIEAPARKVRKTMKEQP